MCLDVINKLFKIKNQIVFPPYPEEPQDITKTVANTNIQAFQTQWATDRNISKESWDYWFNQIDLQIFDIWTQEVLERFGINPDTPAFSFEGDGKRHLYSLASWLTVGCYTHEQCHNSFSLLTEEQKVQWQALYETHKNTDEVLIKLWQYRSYGLSNYLEGHAEIGRYLWRDAMPEWAKGYYPKLL